MLRRFTAAAPAGTIATGYRGADRRRHPSPFDQPLPASFWRTLIVAVVLLLSTPLVVGSAGRWTFAIIGLSISAVGAAVAIAGGLAGIATAVATGRAYPALLGSALISAGVLDLVTDGIATSHSSQASAAASAARLVLALVVGRLLIRAAAAHEVDTSVQPFRTGSTELIAAVGSIVVVEVLAAGIHRDPLSMRWEEVAEALALAFWLLAAATLLGLGTKRRWYAVWGAPLPLAMILAQSIMLLWDPDGRAGVAAEMVASLGTAVTAAVAVAIGWRTLQVQNSHALRLSEDLADVRQVVKEQQHAVEERFHELRNAVGAVRAADAGLRRYEQQLSPEVRSELADALSAEIKRLQTLIGTEAARRSFDFRLSDTLRAVSALQEGLVVPFERPPTDCWVRGDPESLIQVLRNLIINAQKYAPGSPVWIVVERTDTSVEIAVRDAGPGVPPDERDAIFARGGRGSLACGTSGEGLGLYIARQLMISMGGSLWLRDSITPGACFCLELPRVPAPGAELGSSDPAGVAPSGV